MTTKLPLVGQLKFSEFKSEFDVDRRKADHRTDKGKAEDTTTAAYLM